MNRIVLEAAKGVALLAVAFAAPVSAQSPPTQANPVVHVEILGADAPRLQNFYRDLFGWQAKVNPIGYGYVAVAPPAGIPLTGGVGPSPQRQPLVIFYVKVDDPAATLKRAEALGGKTVVPATDAPGGVTFARLADPEGNVVGVVRRPN